MHAAVSYDMPYCWECKEDLVPLTRSAASAVLTHIVPVLIQTLLFFLLSLSKHLALAR